MILVVRHFAANDGNNNYNLTWASVGVSGISSSADATAITIDSNEKGGSPNRLFTSNH